MVDLNNPKSWISLHWKNGTLIQYFGIKNDSLTEDSFNIIKPSDRCINSISDIIDNRQVCRISELKINREDNKCCDNIIPLSDVAMLCGLPGTEYIHASHELLDELKNISSNKDIYEQVKTDYSEYQTKLWSKIYSWSHQECHDIKREFPFLELDFKGGVTIGNVIKENIAKLISELVFIKLLKKSSKKKRTKNKIRNKSNKSNKTKSSMIDKWRSNVLSRYKIIDMNEYGLDRLNELTSEVEEVKQLLLSYDTKNLQKFSYLSLCSILKMIISHTLDLVTINWTTYIIKILTDNGKLIDNTYYTEENLSSDIIYESLLELQKTNTELFQKMILYPDDIKIKTSLNDFYIYLRSYINMLSLLDANLNEEKDIDTQYRECIINVIDYIWNSWSSKTNIKEAKIRGESSDLDRLSRGSQIDHLASKYNNELFYIHILSCIGDKLTDKYDEIETLSDIVDESSETVNTQKKTIDIDSEEIHSMKFKLGDKYFYSNLIRG